MSSEKNRLVPSNSFESNLFNMDDPLVENQEIQKMASHLEQSIVSDGKQNSLPTNNTSFPSLDSSNLLISRTNVNPQTQRNVGIQFPPNSTNTPSIISKNNPAYLKKMKEVYEKIKPTLSPDKQKIVENAYKEAMLKPDFQTFMKTIHSLMNEKKSSQQNPVSSTQQPPRTNPSTVQRHSTEEQQKTMLEQFRNALKTRHPHLSDQQIEEQIQRIIRERSLLKQSQTSGISQPTNPQLSALDPSKNNTKVVAKPKVILRPPTTTSSFQVVQKENIIHKEELIDAASQAGVDIQQEREKILPRVEETNSNLSVEKTEKSFLNIEILKKVVSQQLIKTQLQNVTPEAIQLIVHATEEFLRTIAEKLVQYAEYRNEKPKFGFPNQETSIQSHLQDQKRYAELALKIKEYQKDKNLTQEKKDEIKEIQLLYKRMQERKKKFTIDMGDLKFDKHLIPSDLLNSAEFKRKRSATQEKQQDLKRKK